MRILSRYIAAGFFRVFALCVTAFVCIYLIVDFFENMDAMVRAGAPISSAVEYFALRLPFILYQGIPAAILLAALLTLGTMSRHNEITAMKGAGIDPLRPSSVLLGIGALLGIVMVLLNEWIVPSANRRAEYVRRVEIKKERVLPSFKREGIWFREGRTFYRIDLFSPEEKRLAGIAIYTMGEGFSPVAILTADSAVWSDRRWMLKGVRQRILKNGRPARYEEVPVLSRDLPYTLEDFTRSEKKPEEMNFFELSSYIRRLELSGASARTILPDLHLKSAFPFVCLVMVLVGIPLSLRGSGRMSSAGVSGLALTVGVAFALGFSYWIVLALCLSLGRSGSLPAWLSAWLPNAVFGSLGGILLSRVRR